MIDYSKVNLVSEDFFAGKADEDVAEDSRQKGMEDNTEQDTGQENGNLLFANLDRLHTTEMGKDRIRKNLQLDTDNVVEYCKEKILSSDCSIYKQGKNWYCVTGHVKITVNASSYKIITAHLVK